jgi:toxin-antitoxin system PIN domain toxin
MIDLLDINVWLALIDENHTHHSVALDYWNQKPVTEKAFCRITQLGFLRLSTRKGILSGTLSNEEAWSLYQQFLAQPFVHFVADPPELDEHFREFTSPSLSHRLWTDAYLAAFAITRKMRLVSFDSDFNQFKGLNFLMLTE